MLLMASLNKVSGFLVSVIRGHFFFKTLSIFFSISSNLSESLSNFFILFLFSTQLII